MTGEELPVAARRSGRSGRPPLSEGRKTEIRLRIADEAVRLYVAQGVAATSAEEIATAAGISTRTFWRYTPVKEASVLPLLTTGIEITAHCLRAWPLGHGVTALLDELKVRAGDLVARLPTVLDLIRLSHSEPTLRAVWTQAHHDAEAVFAGIFAERAGVPEDDLTTKMQAAMVNVSLRVAIEHCAARVEHRDIGELEAFETLREALLIAARGFPA